MNPTLHALLTARLEASTLDLEARAEVLAEAGPPAAPAQQEQATGEVYLRSVTVEGFRGIGPEATLELPAHPGLVLVVGRNGSGKSSFAEGLELLMTGRTKRWEEKTLGWTSAWQCLHHEESTRLSASLAIGGQAEPVELTQTWERGAAYKDASDRAAVEALLARHGWASALTSFRPFLAYAELASMFDKLTSLYAALSPILGLDDVEATSERLRARRLGLEQHAKALKTTTSSLRERLGESDWREVALDALLARRKPDPDAVRAHLLAHPPGASAPGTSSAALRAV
ncbi:MAG: AAA family ATPase, partial [Solirubrobacterales bacterium]|nr:AAA family ATPase [Solirubrobacterales bacterium]